MEETTVEYLISLCPQAVRYFRTLSNETVKVLIVRSFQPKVSATDIINGLVVYHERTVGMLKSSMCSKDRIVGLNNGCCGLGGRVDTELQLALLAIVNRKTLHEKSTKARSCATTKRVENKESLETRAIIRNTSNLVQDLINQLLADSVVATSVVVGGILLASNHLLWVEETAVCTSADLINYIWLKIAVNGTRNIFALAYDIRPVSY